MSDLLKRTEVEIYINENGEKKRIKVPAMTHDNAPGLAVTMSGFGLFTVTHIESGLALCATYESYAKALLVLGEYALIARAHGFSYDLSGKEIRGKFGEIAEFEVPFNTGRCLSISGWQSCLDLEKSSQPTVEFLEMKDEAIHSLEGENTED